MERRATARPASARAVLLGAEISTMGRSIGSPVPVPPRRPRSTRARARANRAVAAPTVGRGRADNSRARAPPGQRSRPVGRGRARGKQGGERPVPRPSAGRPCVLIRCLDYFVNYVRIRPARDRVGPHGAAFRLSALESVSCRVVASLMTEALRGHQRSSEVIRSSKASRVESSRA